MSYPMTLRAVLAPWAIVTWMVGPLGCTPPPAVGAQLPSDTALAEDGRAPTRKRARRLRAEADAVTSVAATPTMTMTTTTALSSAPSAPTTPADTQDVPADLGEVLKAADVIAHVRVVSAKGEAGTWGRVAQPIIFTRYTADVVTAAVGADEGALLTFKVPGGQIGEQGFTMSGAPKLHVGDELLLVLDHERAGHPVVGGEAGLLHVQQGLVFAQHRPVAAIDARGYHLGHPPPRGVALPTPVGDSLPVSTAAPRQPMMVAEALSALAALREAP